MRRAWQKNACAKIKGLITRAWALREMGALMYIEESPDSRLSVLDYVKARFARLKTLVSGAAAFWAYIEKYWMMKPEMWVTGNRHIPHAGQDTNAGIESYHGHTKATLKAEKSRLDGRRLDWLIHELTNDVVTKYDYNQYMKENGFITNKKAEQIVRNSIISANKIPDSSVSLPSRPGDPAIVTSSKRAHIRYAVYNPDTEWAVCECVWAQKGNLCKHQLKVLRIMRPDLADGTIVKVCGTLYGTKLGGVSALLNPPGPDIMSETETEPAQEVPQDGNDYNETQEVPADDPPARQEDEQARVSRIIDQMGNEITNRAERHYIIKKHLAAELTEMNTRHAAMETRILAGLLHPTERDARAFERNDPLKPNSLKRNRDFLDRGRFGRPPRPTQE